MFKPHRSANGRADENDDRINGRLKMDQAIKIITDYAAADEDVRLSMFLTHRSLRRHFTEIDMAETTLPEVGTARQARETKNTGRARRFSICCGEWLKLYRFHR